MTDSLSDLERDELALLSLGRRDAHAVDPRSQTPRQAKWRTQRAQRAIVDEEREPVAGAARFEHDFLVSAQTGIDQEFGRGVREYELWSAPAFDRRGSGAARGEFTRRKWATGLAREILVLVRIALEHSLYPIATGGAGAQ